MRDVPRDYRDWTLDKWPAKYAEDIEPLWSGSSLYLHGVVGCGKSCLAAAVLRNARERGLSSGDGAYGEWVSPDKLRTALNDLDNVEIRFAHWKRTKMLVLDDLAAIRATPHALEHVMRLIGRRYEDCLPTVATSNLTLPELSVQLDARVASRFQRGVVLDCGKTDRRAK